MNWRGYLTSVLIVPVLCFQGEVAAQAKIAFTSFSPGDLAAGVFPRIEKNILELAGGNLTVVDDFAYETLGFGRYAGRYTGPQTGLAPLRFQTRVYLSPTRTAGMRS